MLGSGKGSEHGVAEVEGGVVEVEEDGEGVGVVEIGGERGVDEFSEGDGVGDEGGGDHE